MHHSILFILLCYTKLRADPNVNKDFFLFEFFSKDSLSCSKVGATHFIFFSEKKWMHHSPPQMLNSYLIKGERPSLSLPLFYEPRSQYIANQSGSAKETVSPKIGKNIEMLVCFNCMGTQDRTLSLSNYNESK